MSVVIYDVETLKSCFTYSDINKDTEEIHQFVLHSEKFELNELVSYLKTVDKAVGFNNVNFDYPIIHYILNSYKAWKDLKYESSLIISDIHKKAQQIIEQQNSIEFNSIVAVPQKEWKIDQLDLFKLWHYNNPARRQSLKGLEISMNFPNVMECEISHEKEDITLEEVDKILEYNLNDVKATYEFYKRSIGKIKLRQELNKRYKLNCINFSDSKIGEQLILKLYCDATNSNWWDIKQLRTHRSKIALKDCILDYIKFDSPQFAKLLAELRQTTIIDTLGEFKKSIIYKGFKYDFASGGIHGVVKAGVYESDDRYIIKTADVTSLYPNLGIKNKFYPEHLGEIFPDIYSNIIEQRTIAKAEGNTILADGFKLAANSVYGKSNDVNSFLYDPQFTMKVTYNGQLLLAMLAEQLSNISDSQMIMINTDGLEIKIPRDCEQQYFDICKKWEELTKLTLEFDNYQKMVIRDVNNYICINTKGKKKYKGAFEIDKVVGSEPAYHKDNSFRIVPIAISNYFFEGISVEDTIMKHKDIYDFCGRQRFNLGDWGQTHSLSYKDGLPYEKVVKQQRNTRYYISNKGETFIKYYKKGTTQFINKGYLVTIFNKFEEKENYNINIDFYTKECNKIIQTIEDKQLQLL